MSTADDVGATVARSWSVALTGLEGHLVEVEVDVSAGLPGMTLVGLPDAAVVEARDRIRAALLNSAETWPSRRITASLSPASLRKHGSGFDLALAIAVIAAAGQLSRDAAHEAVFIGELALDGCVRPVRGVLPAVLAARRLGVRRVVVPLTNMREAASVPGMRVLAVRSLRHALALLRGQEAEAESAWCATHDAEGRAGRGSMLGGQGGRLARAPGDLADVVGQETGRIAVEAAAAGGHHLLLLGPPGAGKSMLAARLPTVLPELVEDQSLEVTAIHSIAGLLDPDDGLIRRPPFQDPHHTATAVALVGGGSGRIQPGCASLAHHGVLLLDEAPEFSPSALDALRQPLEAGEIVVARSGAHARFPARIQLVMTANPCPCARPSGDTECRCTPTLRRRYLARLSGPLLDRMDIRVVIPPLTRAALADDLVEGETSAVVSGRVAAARAAAASRWAAYGYAANAHVPGALLRGPARPVRSTLSSLDRALDRGFLSVRGYDSVLRVAWSLADLAGRDGPDRDAVQRALDLRQEVAA